MIDCNLDASREAARLNALRDLRILDEPAEPRFDNVTKLAARLFDAPIALISLVDENRQWFQSRVGLEACETARDVAFCDHAIRADQAFYVPDTLVDPRFQSNPLVVGAPYIRSYLGAPLIHPEGHRLGTLCTIFDRPTNFSPDRFTTLEDLAKLVVDLMIARRDGLALREAVAVQQELTNKVYAQSKWLTEIADMAAVGGWEVDLEGQKVIWSDGTRRIHEVPDEFEPELHSAIEFYAPESRQRVIEGLESAIEAQEPFDYEAQLITAKGRRVWVRAVGRPLVIDGEVKRIFGAFQDISSAHERQAALEAERWRMATILEATRVGTWEWDIAHHSTVYSEAWFEMVGLDPETTEASFALFEELVHPLDMPKVEAALKAHFDGENDRYSVDFRMRHADGRWVWIASQGRVIERDEIGAPLRIVGTHADISERIEINRTLAEQKREAEAATQAKSQFLANMSHEIRTPLNGVVGIADALARTELSASQSEMVGLIQTSGETLERILSDILDYSKIEAGGLEISSAPFDLRESLEAAAEVMRVRADEKGIRFHVHYGDAAEGLFDGDAVRVRQIVSNLISNAIKFTQDGGVDVYVEVEEGEPARLTVRVVDTGIGFDKETGARLFGRFQQADGTITRQFGGTGLGLSICKALVSMMDGEIGAESEPGEGSVFFFTVPLERIMPLEDYRRREVGAAEEADLDTGLSIARARILVAEDNPTNQRVVSMIMESFGVSLEMVENGREAVEAMQGGPYDIVLMDMQMPEMDGLAATRAIRRWEAETGRARTPIAMLSANALQEHIDASMEAGCDLHISKPFTPTALVSGVQHLLALHHNDLGEDAA